MSLSLRKISLISLCFLLTTQARAAEPGIEEINQLLQRPEFVTILDEYKKVPIYSALAIADDGYRIAYGIRWTTKYSQTTIEGVIPPEWLKRVALNICKRDAEKKNIPAECQLLAIGRKFANPEIPFNIYGDSVVPQKRELGNQTAEQEFGSQHAKQRVAVAELVATTVETTRSDQDAFDDALLPKERESKVSFLTRLSTEERFVRYFKKYLDGNTYKALAIAFDEAGVAMGSESGAPTLGKARDGAINYCEQRRKAKRIKAECFVYMLEDRYVYPEFSVPRSRVTDVYADSDLQEFLASYAKLPDSKALYLARENGEFVVGLIFGDSLDNRVEKMARLGCQTKRKEFNIKANCLLYDQSLYPEFDVARSQVTEVYDDSDLQEFLANYAQLPDSKALYMARENGKFVVGLISGESRGNYVEKKARLRCEEKRKKFNIKANCFLYE